MSSSSIRKSTLILGALALAACSESTVTPTAVATEAAVAARTSNRHLTEIGSSATWFFKGVVSRSTGELAQVGDIVTGKLTFTFTSDDIWPGVPCAALYAVNSTADFTVQGQSYSLSGPGGHAASYMSCYNPGSPPWVRVHANQDGWVAQIEIANPADNEDFPLAPPPIGGSPKSFSYWDEQNGSSSFTATLTELYAGPQAKEDCKDNGWAQFGFKNQGQCVRYIETGKDSR